jgi:hypothetical protein
MEAISEIYIYKIESKIEICTGYEWLCVYQTDCPKKASDKYEQLIKLYSHKSFRVLEIKEIKSDITYLMGELKA